MKITFYGVRGSIPAPGPYTAKYGGNTLCTEIRGKNTEIILDAGTGIRLLGDDLMKHNNKTKAYLLLSHAHWDHIQGFPFFKPAYAHGNNLHIYIPEQVDINLNNILPTQMSYPYFPVLFKQLSSTITFDYIKEGQAVEIPEFKISNARLNHPFPGVVAYRIDGNKSVVYATDTEHYERLDDGLVKLADKADILIYDSQYTQEEYKHKIGWGHSTGEKGVETAIASKVKKLVLYHYDPSHTDEDIDKILEDCKKIAGKDLEVIAAYERLELDL